MVREYKAGDKVQLIKEKGAKCLPPSLQGKEVQILSIVDVGPYPVSVKLLDGSEREKSVALGELLGFVNPIYLGGE